MFVTSAAGAMTAMGTIAGALGGSKGSGGTTVQQQTLDPRMNDAIYGTQGLVPTMSDWYKNNSSGLNAQMVQGLNQQYSTLNDPFTAAGYNRMGMNGYNLMGGGVAGNPFTSGAASLTGGIPRFGGMPGGMGGMGGGTPMALAPQAQNNTGWGSLGLGGGPFAMPAPAPVAAPAAPAPVQSFADQMAQWQRENSQATGQHGR